MTMILVVSLDLLGPAASYDKLYEELKKQGTWWHYMRWTWLVDTDRTPEQVVDALKPHMQGTDRMLVAPLGRPYQGLLTKEEWSWVTSRMNPQETKAKRG
jgi:hypothetical protein